ncbi:hypothetical protein JHD49_03825 [Sulfurimonas sp. SAG-AH-194-C21]|nr:hypothetical protein [Sulfurimonas sp. SAG-AH-194-C21]MDF1883060.1 hypothetical protein [Sulfurimonas sp. SAG-AH-194-C21]
MRQARHGIALLITIMFVIVISVAIGFGLKQVNKASSIVKNENFMYQSRIIVEDILKILKTSPDIKSLADTNSSEILFLFLSQSSFIPFESSGLEIIIHLSSAREKLNPLALKNSQERQDSIKQYFNNYNINSQYVDLLLDNMSGIKEDNSYSSMIFDENPYLFRDYITSAEHLELINDFYLKEYNDNSLSKIDFNNLFYYSTDENMSIDVNYATTEVWEMLLLTSKARAEFLSNGRGAYTDLASLNLDEDEKTQLALFPISYFEPVLFVRLEIKKEQSTAEISFEYNIRTKQESNFLIQP